MSLTDPRATIRYDEIDAQFEPGVIDNSTITYDGTQPNGSAQVGFAVKRSGNKTWALAGDGDPIEGALAQVESDGFCRVQVGGYVQLPGGNGATLTAGLKAVGALNSDSDPGYIKAVGETVSASPSQAEVQNAFKAARTKATIVDSATTTAVWVRLG